MYNNGLSVREHHVLIIDRHISLEIIRPFVTGLGLLILIFVGFSASRQLSLAAEGQLDMMTAFKLLVCKCCENPWDR